MCIIPQEDFDRLLKSMKENEKRKISVEEYEKGKAAYYAFGFDKLNNTEGM